MIEIKASATTELENIANKQWYASENNKNT